MPSGKGVLRRRLLEAAGFLNDGCASVWIIFYFHLLTQGCDVPFSPYFITAACRSLKFSSFAVWRAERASQHSPASGTSSSTDLTDAMRFLPEPELFPRAFPSPFPSLHRAWWIFSPARTPLLPVWLGSLELAPSRRLAVCVGKQAPGTGLATSNAKLHASKTS